MLTLVMLMHMPFSYHATEGDSVASLQLTIPAIPPWNRFVFFGQAVQHCVQTVQHCFVISSSSAAVFGSSKLLPCHLIINIDVHHLLEIAQSTVHVPLRLSPPSIRRFHKPTSIHNIIPPVSPRQSPPEVASVPTIRRIINVEPLFSARVTQLQLRRSL